MSTKHLREMASGLHDGMGGHADACSELMEQAAKQLDEMKAKIEQLSAQVEVAEAGYQAAIQKAEWQARTNTELNALTLKMAKLVGQCDQLQQQLEAERASLFAESQRKQQLEARVNELESQELSWRKAMLSERKKVDNLLSWMEHIQRAALDVSVERTAIHDAAVKAMSEADGDAAIEAAKGGAEPAICDWHQEDDDGSWHSSCGAHFTLNEGTPSENQMKFCHHCGKPLAEHPYQEDDE